jgi:16S rRNA (guanine(966)-N(2))-methyltransferase RsmD
MIRIGAGELAGRIIEQPKTSKTRPLTSKVRASIFNRLGDISGLTVLDAYAGSGAFGIEALSLGAKHVTFIEKSRPVSSVITSNLDKLNLGDRAIVLTQDVVSACKDMDSTFDIVLADPPYAELDKDQIQTIFNLLKPTGIAIVSHSSRMPSLKLTNVDLLDARIYGDTTISYYRGKIG